jgi:hypothetical protein
MSSFHAHRPVLFCHDFFSGVAAPFNSTWPNRFPKGNASLAKLTPAEKEIYAVYKKVKWCDISCAKKLCSFDWSAPFWDRQRLTGAGASNDCYGMGVASKE